MDNGKDIVNQEASAEENLSDVVAQSQASKKPSTKKKGLIIGIIAAAVLIVAAGVLVTLSLINSYKKPIEDLAKIYENNDVEGYIDSCEYELRIMQKTVEAVMEKAKEEYCNEYKAYLGYLPDEAVEEIEKKLKTELREVMKEYENSLEDAFEERQKEIKENAGSDFTVRVEFHSKEKANKERLENDLKSTLAESYISTLPEDMAEQMGEDLEDLIRDADYFSDIEGDIYKVEYSLIAEGEKGEYKFFDRNIVYVGKADGEWVIVCSDFDKQDN